MRKEIQDRIDSLKERNIFCFISNTAFSFAGGRRTNLTPNGEWAVTFMTPGSYIEEPHCIHADFEEALLGALKKAEDKIMLDE
jgi:hypothetical protein